MHIAMARVLISNLQTATLLVVVYKCRSHCTTVAGVTINTPKRRRVGRRFKLLL